MRAAIASLIRDESGVNIIEYALLLLLVGGATIFVVVAMGNTVKAMYQLIVNNV
jgi:Flp pilus assembly pilin Flp